MAPSEPESVRFSEFGRRRRSLRIVMVWVIVSSGFLLSMLLVYPWVSNVLILRANKNAYPYAEQLLRQGKAVQAARLLESMVECSYDYVAPGDTRYAKVADAWKEAGNVEAAKYWEARASYFDAYWHHLPYGSVDQLNKIWGDALARVESLSILKKVDPEDLDKTNLNEYFLDSFLYWGEPVPDPTRKWASGLTQEDKLGMLLASGDLSLGIDGRIGETDLRITFPIEVYSSGGRFKKGALVRVGAKTVFEQDGSMPAVCAVVISPENGGVEEGRTFETSSDRSQWRKMVSWAKGIPEGRIVAVAVSTTVAGTIDEIDQLALREFLGEFGVEMPTRHVAARKIIAEQAFAGLGVRGAPKGTGQRVLGEYLRDQALIMVFPRREAY